MNSAREHAHLAGAATVAASTGGVAGREMPERRSATFAARRVWWWIVFR
ncbi:hypothetical protein QF035_000463 [Streptomyces umbrinus]|uniref:Uncharacterized protein n=1 Tax=Streptomyces umbrinus TaxID=67370 RepID=A0ABU0SH40_9ACTN|nr:hypothetical protein [Streptomyces umbrinus]MDQ1022881.1 hypothetical protein [Streptomyces umbrinus]